MQLKVSDIAAQVRGRVQGDGTAVIRGAAGLEDARAADISFVRDAKSASVTEKFLTTQAGAVLVPAGYPANGRTVIEVDNPLGSFCEILALIARETEVRPDGVSKAAHIDPSATIGANVRIGPGCVIEKGAVIEDGVSLIAQVFVGARSRVGQNSVLYPQVVIREGISVGKNCIIHSGAVIGADGYGFYFAGGKHNKIPQIGTVIIDDDVEIGANSCVDRAMTGATVIGRGSKIDNLVQIAHNVQLGPLCLIVAQVGIAGSSKLGAGVVMAGQSGMADHITVGDGAKIAGRAGVIQDVPANAEVTGFPAQPMTSFFKQHLMIRRLPELFRELKKLKESIGNHD